MTDLTAPARFLTGFLLFAGCTLFGAPATAQSSDSLQLRKIFDEALVNGKSYSNLEYLCKRIGPRLSGSANAQKAVEWTEKVMKAYGFDAVYRQEVLVPHWVRGEKEVGKILAGKKIKVVAIAALGGSVGTPAAGITAGVIEVRSLAEVEQLGEAAIKGKIVFFNRPMDPRFIETFLAYGGAGDQRRSGPSQAAKFGAVGVIVRSLTTAYDDYPHTGGTAYQEGIPQIPAAAISTVGAETLSKAIAAGPAGAVKFYLKQSCRTLPDVLSYNVIGEITGSENPEKIITVGGHLDSWDLAEGAHDDGTGIVQSIEVLRIFKALGIRPRCTMRAVMFMNEENGARGGVKYAELAKAKNETHIAALESDAGGFTPRGFSFEHTAALVAKVNTSWKSLLEPYGAAQLTVGPGGTDIGPLRAMPGIVLIGFRPDPQRYFDIHHTPNDVFENVNRRELELGGAAMAGLVYLIDRYGLPK